MLEKSTPTVPQRYGDSNEINRLPSLPSARTGKNKPDLGDRSWPGFVADPDAIKIGWTTRPALRLTDLRTEFPNVGPMWMVGSIATVPYTERMFHRRFEHLRIKGEWFRAAPDLVKFIDELEASGQLIHDDEHQAQHRKVRTAHRYRKDLEALRSSAISTRQ